MDDKTFKEYYEIERLRYCMGVVADWLNEHREYEIVEGEYRGTREFAIQTKHSPTMAEIEAIYPFCCYEPNCGADDDTISRQAAIDALWEEPSYSDPLNVLTEARDRIKSLPSAERREGQSSECEYWDNESNFCTLYRPSAERRGRWEDVEHAPNGLLYATCSVCGKRQTVEAVNYCGNCGAKMEGEEE